MSEDGPAKLLIQIKSDWLLICFILVTKSPGLVLLRDQNVTQQTKTQKMADQVWFDLNVVFTMSLCALQL